MSENEKTAEEIDLIISVGSEFVHREALRINAASANLLVDAELIRDRLTDIGKSMPQGADADKPKNPAA